MEDEQASNLAEYGSYVEDIRKRIFKLAVWFAAAFGIGFFASGYLITHTIKFFRLANVTIAASSPFQFFDLSMNIGFFFALMVFAPLATQQLYSFLKPAMTKRERKFFLRLLPLALFLFVLGFFYGFFTLYISLRALADVNIALGIANFWDVGKFVVQVALTGILLGLLFQLPILMTVLIRLGFISIQFLKEKRRHAFVVMLVFVGLLPPTDMLSLFILALPLLIMYEAIIIINRAYSRPRVSTQIYV